MPPPGVVFLKVPEMVPVDRSYAAREDGAEMAVAADALKDDEVVLARWVDHDFALHVRLRQAGVFGRPAGEGDDELAQFAGNRRAGLRERERDLAFIRRVPRVAVEEPFAR